jgi:hypothetical protein
MRHFPNILFVLWFLTIAVSMNGCSDGRLKTGRVLNLLKMSVLPYKNGHSCLSTNNFGTLPKIWSKNSRVGVKFWSCPRFVGESHETPIIWACCLSYPQFWDTTQIFDKIGNLWDSASTKQSGNFPPVHGVVPRAKTTPPI